MGIDGKYGRVSTERGTIGEDEVVVLFRAQDVLLAPLLEHYHRLCEDAGSPPRHLDAVDDARREVRRWQATNITHIPQSATYQPAQRLPQSSTTATGHQVVLYRLFDGWHWLRRTDLGHVLAHCSRAFTRLSDAQAEALQVNAQPYLLVLEGEPESEVDTSQGLVSTPTAKVATQGTELRGPGVIVDRQVSS